MSKQVWVNGNANVLSTASSSSYNNVFGAGNGPWNTNVLRRRLIVPAAGTVSNLRVQLSAAPGVGATRTFSLSFGTVAQALTVTFDALDTDMTDAVNSVTVAPGDAISLKATHTLTVEGPAATTVKWSMQFESTVAGETIYGGTGAGQHSTSAQSYQSLLNPCGDVWGSGSTIVANLAPADGTITALFLALDNASSGSVGYSVYLNGTSEPTSSITPAAGVSTGRATGLSIAFVAGDLLTVGSNPFASGGVQRRASFGVAVTMSTAGESMLVGQTTDSPSTSADEFHWIGAPHSSIAWQAAVGTPDALCGPSSFSIRDARIKLAAPPGTASSGWHFQWLLNDAATALDIAIAGTNQTGTDADSVSYANGDLVAVKAVRGSTIAQTGEIRWGAVQFIPDAAPPAGGSKRPWQMGTVGVD